MTTSAVLLPGEPAQRRHEGDAAPGRHGRQPPGYLPGRRPLFALPPFQPDKPPVDNWQTSAWMRRAPGPGGLPAARADDHFD